ncbi:phosphonate ABC transporter ATP-binding protein [Hymenobacter qilianensis]|uniref:Cell division ATP-binding protein FtsE n=3 Tax=Hymenobacter TaxID=89966 RepID=A0A1W1W4M1_9BACT|nr:MULTISPECIES: ATP-binding cassette domain-containing protein [Hymenobacter]QNP52125.1 ATP-binding cassette domain-containing protein [Hymenobacter qilianensis]GGF64656.1 phosphonate ABC transporter ATP-binding protein [Hymenobacter qilianensis]SMC00463.1 ABC transporter related [Hymenobacter roseosalivarius DSM 11622]
MSDSAVPVVELHDAYIMQDVNTVLQKITFTLEKGEFAYLVGRTGSGKSSLLKTLYADLPLGGGVGTVAGFPLQKLSSGKVPYLRRKLGIIFQDFQLLFDRTVAENLIFVLKATGWSGKARIQNRLSEVLMRVGLANSASKMPHQLSGGEQQRVVIARALLNEPLLLLADEPTGNLDPEVAADIMRLFVEINNAGTAVLMATHNYQIIRQYPKRVLKCENGQLIDSTQVSFKLTE